jgi:hypothetical protein
VIAERFDKENQFEQFLKHFRGITGDYLDN